MDKTSDGKNIILPPHANILRFITCAKVVEDMLKHITEDSDKDRLLHDGEFPQNPLVLTEVNEAFKKMSITQIKDIEFCKEVPQQDYRLNFSVVSHEPQDIREIVTAYCPVCMHNMSLKNSDKKAKKKEAEEVYKCDKCSGPCELVYQL